MRFFKCRIRILKNLFLDTLQQLFLSELLIESRKLRTFDRNPFSQLQQLTGGNKDTRDRSVGTGQ